MMAKNADGPFPIPIAKVVVLRAGGFVSTHRLTLRAPGR